MNPVLEAIFGNQSALQVLFFIQAYRTGYASQIADAYSAPLNTIYSQLRRLENGGVLVSRLIGKTRVFEFNPRNPTVKNLQMFLERELQLLPESDQQLYYAIRQRPRRTNKGK